MHRVEHPGAVVRPARQDMSLLLQYFQRARPADGRDGTRALSGDHEASPLTPPVQEILVDPSEMHMVFQRGTLHEDYQEIARYLCCFK